jgi:pilus assembly protein CpaE
MTIFCEPEPRAAAALAGRVAGAHPHATLPAALTALAADSAESLVVLGAGVDLDQALAFAERQRRERPALGVVLLRRELDVAALRRAMRAGIRDVVAADDVDGLLVACRRSQELSAQTAAPSAAAGPGAPPQGRIITVFSAKGGVGKTTLAINLAAVLREGGSRVCLVDLDLAFGDVAISLQLAPKRTMVDALTLGDQLDAAKVASLLTAYRPGLDCLLAPVEPGDAEKVPPALFAELLRVLREMFDHVVVDSPSQFSEHVLIALDASQHHVLLTTPEIPALKNMRLALDMLDLLSYSGETRTIVLNRSDTWAGLSTADVERVVKSRVAGHVPSSRDVPASINRGEPLALEQPDHPVSQAIRQLAQQHLGGAPAAGRGRRRGGLARMRRRSA